MPEPRTPMSMSPEPPSDPKNRGAALYRLLAWLSPGFPVGAFSYSHGLEAAAAAGMAHDRVTLQGWIAAIVVQGSGRIDADILRDAYRAAEAGDPAALAAANQRGCTYRATAELALEASQQGEAFLRTCLAAWPDAFLEAWAAPHPSPRPASAERGSSARPRLAIPHLAVGEREDVAQAAPCVPSPRLQGEGQGEGPFHAGVCHSAVFGAAAAGAGIALDDALIGYLQAFAANLMSAGLRLGLIGQTDGQRILAALEPIIAEAAAAAATRDPADFGAATFAVDLASMAHETQYSRLFRS
jgi:urease accessory protein